MDIKEIKEEKKRLEEEILFLLQKFERETLCQIKDIHFDSDHFINSYHPIVNFRLSIEI